MLKARQRRAGAGAVRVSATVSYLAGGNTHYATRGTLGYPAMVGRLELVKLQLLEAGRANP